MLHLIYIYSILPFAAAFILGFISKDIVWAANEYHQLWKADA